MPRVIYKPYGFKAERQRSSEPIAPFDFGQCPSLFDGSWFMTFRQESVTRCAPTARYRESSAALADCMRSEWSCCHCLALGLHSPFACSSPELIQQCWSLVCLITCNSMGEIH
mmetsp:Transcript_50047/g.106477  ORF Transcript_50047/g.106477 Transcript_50047/m.106477 type:complete len:113 (-) Transcript_50047:4-342(-)